MVEENHHYGSNIVSTSVGSSIKINSISIDLIGMDDKIDAGTCERFSIRGYVSEVRKRDPKKCWPFALSGNQQYSEEQTFKLPPLLVPKFRWWRCENCVREISAAGTINDSDTLLTPGSNWTLPPKKSSHHKPASDKNDKDAKVTTSLVVVEDANQTVTGFVGAAMEVIPILKSQHTNEIAALETDFNTTMKPHMVKNKSQETTGLELASKISDCAVSSSMRTTDKEKEVYMNGKHFEYMTAPGLTEIAGAVDVAPEFVRNPSLELEDCDNVSSESAILATKGLQSYHHDNIAGLHRRKTRKLRLLSELLGKNGDADTAGKDPHSTTAPLSSEGLKTTSASKGETSLRGKIKRELVRNKRRKSQEDEEWKPPEMITQNHYAKRKLSVISTSSDTSDSTDDSDSGHNVPSRGNLRNDLENWTSNHEVKGVLDNSKAIIKKGKVVEEQLFLPLSQEKQQKDTRKSARDSANGKAVENALSSLVNSTIRRKDSAPCPLHAWKTEVNPALFKEKSKLHVGSNKEFPILRNSELLPENLTAERESEVHQRKSVAVPFRSKQDAFAEKGLDLSLSSKGSDQCDGKFRFEGQPAFLWPWLEGTSRDSLSRLKDSRFLSETESYAYLQSANHLDFSTTGTGNRMPFHNEKQKPASETADCNWPSMKRLDASGARNKDKSKGILERFGPADNTIKQRMEKESELSILDEVPMEIVELMAKNQYERCLPDAEENKHRLQGRESSPRLQLIDLNKAYENGSSNASQDETYQEPKAHGRNRKNLEFTRAEHISAPKQRLVDFSTHAERDHHNISKFGEPYTPGFWAFSQNQEKPPAPMQFSAINPSRQSAPSSQFIGNMVSQSCASSLHLLRPCNTFHSVPQQSKGTAHIWPPSVLNPMPYGSDMPQKHIDQTRTVNRIPNAGMTGDKDLNIWNINALEDGKRKRVQGECSYGCKHSGMRSLDPYSNDSIPAMHLLSLMDPGLGSNSTIDPNRNPKFLGRPSPSQGFICKDFVAGQYVNANTLKHVSSHCNGKGLLSEACCETFPGTSGCSSSLLPLQHGFSRPICSAAQSSLKNQDKGKTKDFRSPTDNRSHKVQKSGFKCGHVGKTIGSVYLPGVKGLILGSSADASRPSSKCFAIENGAKQRSKEQSNNTVVLPPKTSSGPLICSLNKNPADFTIPDAKNIYMLRGEDLKFRKRASFGRKASVRKPDVTKRKKKICSEQGHA